ncbi:protoporphyrinogen oxidase [Brochothrix campestris]|uniref:Coproporphyrinogen III oxidase n=3 Tax=Brochothrix campestris TaxID=2757 RepID=W7CSZ8_9LIST|nr:protoporphyrinogen oxidase [Brochothrix campestris]EUJ38911.1 protoporphyrinogen oxidase [Brochothrix campestris FSL F6-1037]
MIQLINTLVAQLPPERLQANQGIERVSELPNQRYQLTFVDGSQTSVDEVVFAITQPQVARLLPELNSPLAGQTVSSSATVSLGYRQSEIPSLPEGTGFLMTRAKAEQMTACTWVHTKWPHMVPKGRVLLRIFLGRSDQPNISRMSDSELIVLAQQQASALMGITASPEVVEVSKMSETMPQYAVNHHMRVEQLRQQTAGKHLHFIGMSYEGVGMPDCIRLAKECADNLKNK